ncbi:hypothetical protein [Sphingomonas sp.]|uniref:hypothetical protein n=1 Tax=Sphingomonas sp. TaxID=28214 RepID=UPI002DF2CD6C|nr:hypothetical protein [Sphingomonas sp.]
MTINGASDFIIRTEDLRPDAALALYVPTPRDEALITLLASQTPLVLEGSRGTGKSLLLRVCEQRQLQVFANDKVLPVYLSFVKSSLIDTGRPNQFVHWMLARLSGQIVRTIQKKGLGLGASRALSVLTGGTAQVSEGARTRLEEVAEAFEQSYKRPREAIDDTAVPEIEDFRDAVEDICDDLGIERFNILFDEAAHIFRPEQQRQFFTLFRDLRSPRMTCNAAVYPGVTAYGSTFEGTHDARVEQLSREIGTPAYFEQMRDIVLRQASPELATRINENGETFKALAYAVSGNPRILLKTVAKASRMSTGAINGVIKEFFRNEVWAEHSGLSGRYPGHKSLINWGRRFVETAVIPEAKKKNDGWRERGASERSNVIWVSRDAPEAAKEALRLLTYTGILSKVDDGIKGTASQIGSRYSINVGCLVAEEANPVEVIHDLRRYNSIKRFTEFGASRREFAEISESVGKDVEADMSVALGELLTRSVDDLDLSAHQRQALRSVGVDTIAKALSATEQDFQAARYIGPVRSRQMKNVVMAAALEYLSG